MTTNYVETFIQVAEDCPAGVAQVPPITGGTPTVASLQHELISRRPYELTSDDILFEVFAIRRGVPAAERDAARVALFAKPQACLRASPLGKRYGWGIHHDGDGRVAVYGVESAEYRALLADPGVRQLRAMRSRRG